MLTDEQIFDILDGCANTELMQEHVHLMGNSLSYQQYFKEVQAIHLDLAGMALEKPSIDFTENVLSAIPAEKAILVLARRRAWSNKLTYGFFGMMGAVVLIAISIAIFYQPSSEITVEQPNIILKGLNSFLSQHFTKIAILLNLIVMLVIFDRKILKPYFKHRKITLG